MGRRIVVIGGGNVALDVARTAARGGEQENLQRTLSIVQALDVARSAIRFGAREVDGLLPRIRKRDACDRGRGRGGRGARASTSATGSDPSASSARDGTVTGVEFLAVSRVFDENGPLRSAVRRRAPRRHARPTP